MSGRTRPVEIAYAEVIHQTDDALLLQVHNDDEEEDFIWLPKSEVLSHDEVSRAVEIPEWLAKDRGLL